MSDDNNKFMEFRDSCELLLNQTGIVHSNVIVVLPIPTPTELIFDSMTDIILQTSVPLAYARAKIKVWCGMIKENHAFSRPLPLDGH